MSFVRVSLTEVGNSNRAGFFHAWRNRGASSCEEAVLNTTRLVSLQHVSLWFVLCVFCYHFSSWLYLMAHFGNVIQVARVFTLKPLVWLLWGNLLKLVSVMFSRWALPCIVPLEKNIFLLKYWLSKKSHACDLFLCQKFNKEGNFSTIFKAHIGIL